MVAYGVYITAQLDRQEYVLRPRDLGRLSQALVCHEYGRSVIFREAFEPAHSFRDLGENTQ